MKFFFRIGMATMFLQSAALADGAPAARDYAPAFARFFAAGLPDVTGASYVKLNLQGSMIQGMTDHAWEQFEQTGNAWLLTETEGGPAAFVVAQAMRVDVYDWRSYKQLAARIMRREARNATDAGFRPWRWSEGLYGGAWTSADLTADLATLMERFQRPPVPDDRHGTRDFALINNSGRALLTAALAHRQGLTNEANALADAIFRRVERPEIAFQRAVDHLAGQLYKNAHVQWTHDGDWVAYRDRLNTFIEQCRGWVFVPSVERVRDGVNVRIANPEPPPLRGATLTAEDQALARTLATVSPVGGSLRHFGLWIFPVRSGFAVSHEDERDPVAQIIKRGVASIPLLLAMLDDDYLTSVRSESVYGMMRSSSTKQGAAPAEEDILFRMDSLDRPATRADVARLLLNQLITGGRQGMQGYGDLSRAELKATFQAWLREHGDKPLIELARYYFAEGSDLQRQTAAFYLLTAGTLEDIAAVRTMIVEADEIGEAFSLLATYLAGEHPERDELAASMLARYRAALDNADAPDNWRQRQIKRNIEVLEEFASGRTASSYLDDVLADREYFEQKTATTLLGRGSLRAGVGLMMRTIEETSDPEARAQMLQTLVNYRFWRTMSFPGIMQRATEEEMDSAWILRDYHAQWLALLEDDRTANRIALTGPVPVNVVAANSIITLATKGYFPAWVLLRQAGRRADPWTVETARGLLTGTLDAVVLPPDLSDPEKADLVQRLQEADHDTFPALLEALTLPELMMLEEVGRDDAGLIEKFSRVGLRTTFADFSGEAEGDQAWPPFPGGQLLSRALVMQLMGYVRDEAEAGRAWRVTVSRSSVIEGMIVSRGAVDDPQAWPEGWGPIAGRRPAVHGRLYAGEHRVRADWPLPGREALMTGDASSYFRYYTYGEELFLEALDMITASTFDPFEHVSITFVFVDVQDREPGEP